MITLKRVKFTGINEAAPVRYSIEKELLPFIEKRIIGRFESTLKEKTGFSDENRPAAAETVKFTLDNISFPVTIKPTTKRPSYKGMYIELSNYLKVLKQEQEKRLRREGILTIDGQAYVSVDLLIDYITTLRNSLTEGTEGVSFSINYEIPDSLVELVEKWKKLEIDPMHDYGTLRSGNGIVYVQMNKLKEAWSTEFIIPFDNNLYAMAGYNEGEVPSEKIEAKYQIGNYYFYVILEPYSSTSYAEIIKGLIHSTERITKKTGDLIKIQRNISDPELAIYNQKMKDGKKYISLDGLIQRLSDLLKKNTTREVRKRIEFYHL